MRARAHVEELRGGKSAIVVTELPYGVKKGGDSGVIKKIADLVNDKVITEVSDLADHSDKTGMRIQIELKRDAIPQVVLNKLFKHTALQTTFGYNAVALAGRRAPDAVAARADPSLPRLPARDRHAPVEVRAPAGGEARAHPPGLPDRARQPRRRDRPDPRVGRHRRGAHRPDGDVLALRGPGAGDPRPSARAAHRSRAQGDRGRVRRPAGAHRRAPLDPRRPGEDRRPDPRGAARGQADLRQGRRPPHRDRRRRGLARARGHDRRGGHGHRDHALRLHQAAPRDAPIASSAAAGSA